MAERLPMRLLRDLGMLACYALLLLPVYFLLNAYWKSVLELVLLYGILALLCWRLGYHVRRVMRRLPAEIPPWQPLPVAETRPPAAGCSAVETIRSVGKDPVYLQEVFKPRLRHLLAYRLSGRADTPFEALDARLAPALFAFLAQPEATGLWARYVHRRRRLRAVLEALARLEAL
ncbi:MAG: hypothetical protein KatS3mg131_3047 [Candidatus Tectimicrobiota bacterium]|nr:MAG: hypothetical protein KatS3mg131_3047 [Candidatus Tectomicrobia bacterium]